jgi:hypothetical protein
MNIMEGSLLQISSFGSEVFKVSLVKGYFLFANMIGAVTPDGIFTEYTKSQIKEKKKTTPEYFDEKLFQFTLIGIEVFFFSLMISFVIYMYVYVPSSSSIERAGHLEEVALRTFLCVRCNFKCPKRKNPKTNPSK